MTIRIKGRYKDHKLELAQPLDLADGTEVELEVHVPGEDGPRNGPVDLRERGIDELAARDLRHRLSAFAEDWERPEMDVYDQL